MSRSHLAPQRNAMRRATLATLLLVRATVAEAFLPRASTFGRVVAVRGSAEDDDALLQSAGWPGVKDILNQLPTFCVANAEGQPLQYEADGKPLAMFYTCVDAAKAELADAKKEYPDLDLDIIPMGLGEAFRLARSGAAVLVPSARSLLAAGAPPTATPVGQEVPLFCCMEMSQEGPDGGAILPMFMEESECRDAVAQAAEADGGAGDDPLEVVGLSLDRAVAQLCQLDRPAFHFVPPRSSMAHIQQYLDASGGVQTPADAL